MALIDKYKGKEITTGSIIEKYAGQGMDTQPRDFDEFKRMAENPFANIGGAALSSVTRGFEQERETGGLERLANVGKSALEGAGKVIGGVGEAIYGGTGLSVINPLDTRTLAEKSQIGIEGINKAISGVGQITGAPFEMSPGLKGVVAAPFEALGQTAKEVLKARGVDPESQEGQNIVNSIMNAAGLALTVKGLKGKEPISLKEGVQTFKEVAKDLKGLPQKLGKVGDDMVINSNIKELTNLQKNNAVIRRAIDAAEKRGFDVKGAIAKTDLLKKAVDKDGTIRLDNSIEKLNKQLKPFEGVVRKNLEQEGRVVPLKEVEQVLMDKIQKSKLKGGAKTRAMRSVREDIEGYGLDADADGNISVANLHDAKIDKQANINYLNPETQRVDKLVANGLKKLVEDNTDSINVKQINAELRNYYSMRDVLAAMNNRKVAGGRMGINFAQTIGGIAGSALGPVGVIAGAEIGRAIKGASMAKKLKGGPETSIAVSSQLQKAAKQAGE